MGKTKHLKYERVRSLANVFMAERPEKSFPWLNMPLAEKAVILELGCGKGEHALALAQTHPNRTVVGVDIKSHRLCTGGEKAIELGLSNLFFLRSEVGQIRPCFRAGSVQEIWITFPDPHPKQREIKHRLTAPDFMALYVQLLVPGGQIHLKTDSELFYTYTLGMVADWGGCVAYQTCDLYAGGAVFPGADTDGGEESEGKAPSQAAISSAFERKALNRNKTIKYLRFTLN